MITPSVPTALLNQFVYVAKPHSQSIHKAKVQAVRITYTADENKSVGVPSSQITELLVKEWDNLNYWIDVDEVSTTASGAETLLQEQ